MAREWRLTRRVPGRVLRHAGPMAPAPAARHPIRRSPLSAGAAVAHKKAVCYLSAPWRDWAARVLIRETGPTSGTLRSEARRSRSEPTAGGGRNDLAKEETYVSGMAGRYAQALFDLAKESNSIDKIGGDLATFAGLVDESADLRRFLKSPAFAADDQVKALDEILKRAGIAGAAANFLKLVAAKRRLFAVGDMIRDFNKLRDAERGVARAEVTVAEPLKEAHVLALKDAIAAVADSSDVDVSVKVDPAIIGGMVVKLGSRMIDSSLRTKLNMIRTRMKEVG
jgi:F-type H+-transporting ATPase subunit delta